MLIITGVRLKRPTGKNLNKISRYFVENCFVRLALSKKYVRAVVNQNLKELFHLFLALVGDLDRWEELQKQISF